MDIVDHRFIAFHTHHFCCKLPDIFQAYGLELIEVVTAVKVVFIDLVKPVLGILHPDQNYDRQRLINQVPYRSELIGDSEGIVDLIDDDHSIFMSETVDALFVEVVGGSCGR